MSAAPRELDTGWERVLREAADQAVADREIAASMALAFGQPIAWDRKRHGETVGFTELHCVGDRRGADVPFTACGFSIPSADRWLRLSPAMIRVMPKCRYCEAEVARVAKENVA